VQESPRGLADAFIIGADFTGSDPCALVLGDNVFYGRGFSDTLRNAVTSVTAQGGGAIFGYYVKDPRMYGVVEFDGNTAKVLSLEEKPENPKSNYAVPGLYFYDSTVVEKAKNLKPSKRGELEITDLNKVYLQEGSLSVELFGKRQGFYISCIEEIAWHNKWITTQQLYDTGNSMSKTEYGAYLLELAKSQ